MTTPEQHGIRRLLSLCDGCMTLGVLTAEVVQLPLTGDRIADTMKAAGSLLLRQIGRRCLARAASCVFCHTVLWRGAAPAAVGLLLPFGLSGEHDVIGMLICSNCAVDRSNCELAHRVIGLMPDARALPPMVNSVGHA